jgi:MoaA/NifB/PqqE/SkfB family radical SAM enzyme
MEKKELRRIDLYNRTKLETVIPLSTPFIINVDPSDACNFKCSFCPTGDLNLMNKVERPLKTMDFDLFKKIVDDIQDFEQPLKVLRLYKDGEPLLNKRFADMVKYGKDSGNILRVDTTTNASGLNPKRNLEIINAGLDRINISVEGMNSEQYSKFSKFDINFEKFVENIRHFYENKKQCEVVIKINGDLLNEEQVGLFHETFKDISDGCYVEHVMSCWPEFELRDEIKVNEDFGIYGQEIKDISVCPYPFYSMSVNSDGQVSLCFIDWAKKLIVGNANIENIRDVWLGKKMKDYQKMFLLGKRKNHPVCGSCGQLSHGLPDNIDKFALQLIERL